MISLTRDELALLLDGLDMLADACTETLAVNQLEDVSDLRSRLAVYADSMPKSDKGGR